ncbi:hypothetical protein NPIL_144041 [Nephila pilipes]|uniref:Uncharacterized protein n=1 Tax=Nephila pilipes TaxID=299642 RepID=A0A8X6T3A7_NEPPI|nr:hypothetical protein NPIL_144041 [Nephila pilipes]
MCLDVRYDDRAKSSQLLLLLNSIVNNIITASDTADEGKSKFTKMFPATCPLLKILLLLVVICFLVQQTEGFCVKAFCDVYPVFQYVCCSMNPDCCASANLEDNNCIKVVIASD